MNSTTAPSDGPDNITTRIPTEQAFVTKAQLAEVLGVCPRTIDNWVRHKIIPSVPISARCRRFIVSSVVASLRRLETEVVR